MCDCNGAAERARQTPQRPCDRSTLPCQAATIRFISDSGAADHSGAVRLSRLAVSNLKTGDNLPHRTHADDLHRSDTGLWDNKAKEITDTSVARNLCVCSVKYATAFLENT